MGKIKTEVIEAENDSSTINTDGVTVKLEELSYEEKIANCNEIAKPMASKKFAKKCYKLIKKAMKHKTYIRCGLKDVQTRIRKGETGIVVFAGDVTPIDIMVHLPGVCENKNIPYVYIPSRKDLGAAMGVKRGCLTVLIRPNNDYEDAFKEVEAEMKNLALTL